MQNLDTVDLIITPASNVRKSLAILPEPKRANLFSNLVQLSNQLDDGNVFTVYRHGCTGDGGTTVGHVSNGGAVLWECVALQL
jgi:hypothetical protein